MDNAVIAVVFRNPEARAGASFSFKSRVEAQGQIFRYIEGFYNRQRRHSAISFSRRKTTSSSFSKGPLRESTLAKTGQGK